MVKLCLVAVRKGHIHNFRPLRHFFLVDLSLMVRWVGWWWCAKSFSCQTQLSLNCVKLFWGCFGVVVGVLTIGKLFDNVN